MLLQCVGPENDFIPSFPWRVYCFMDPYFPFNIRPSDNLHRISYDLPWCRHGTKHWLKCTFTFNKAVLTVLFVGKIPCLLTIVLSCFYNAVLVPDGQSLGTLFQIKIMWIFSPSGQISIKIFWYRRCSDISVYPVPKLPNSVVCINT